MELENSLNLFFSFYFILEYSLFTVLLVSGVQQVIVIHIHLYILFQVLFLCKLLPNLE